MSSLEGPPDCKFSETRAVAKAITRGADWTFVANPSEGDKNHFFGIQTTFRPLPTVNGDVPDAFRDAINKWHEDRERDSFQYFEEEKKFTSNLQGSSSAMGSARGPGDATDSGNGADSGSPNISGKAESYGTPSGHYEAGPGGYDYPGDAQYVA